MKDDVDVTEYIAKMLLDGEWGGHLELVAFSELYNVQIHIFGSIGSEQISQLSLHLMMQGQYQFCFLTIIMIAWYLDQKRTKS